MSRTEEVGKNQCLGCKEEFNSLAAFDMHRVGKHHLTDGPDRRRCLTADEMTAKGMVKNNRKLWVTRLRDTGFPEDAD